MLPNFPPDHRAYSFVSWNYLSIHPFDADPTGQPWHDPDALAYTPTKDMRLRIQCLENSSGDATLFSDEHLAGFLGGRAG